MWAFLLFLIIPGLILVGVAAGPKLGWRNLLAFVMLILIFPVWAFAGAWYYALIPAVLSFLLFAGRSKAE